MFPSASASRSVDPSSDRSEALRASLLSSSDLQHVEALFGFIAHKKSASLGLGSAKWVPCRDISGRRLPVTGWYHVSLEFVFYCYYKPDLFHFVLFDDKNRLKKPF